MLCFSLNNIVSIGLLLSKEADFRHAFPSEATQAVSLTEVGGVIVLVFWGCFGKVCAFMRLGSSVAYL